MLRWLVGCKGAQESASEHEGCRWVQRTRVAASLPPENEVLGKVMFYTCVSFCSQGGSLFPSMHHRSHDRGGLCPGGSLSRKVSVQMGSLSGGGTLSRGRSLSLSSLYGTHLNGMHSGFSIVLQNQHLLWRFQANWLRINQDIWDVV